MGFTRSWISSVITRFGVDSFGHLLVFAAGHWLHSAACRTAARERQGDRESQTKADFSEEVVFRFHIHKFAPTTAVMLWGVTRPGIFFGSIILRKCWR